MKNEPEASVRLAERTLRQTRHICAFFNSREEQNTVLMPFFKEGFDRGEKIFHMIDPRLRAEHASACRAAGIDAEAAQESGQLEIRSWDDTYLTGGHFDGPRMTRFLEDLFQESREKYALTRLLGNMEWALEAAPGVTDIVEYETNLNYVSRRYPDPIVCAYDLNRHSGSVVMDILRTHPMVIVGGVLQENPLYVPPDEFLDELRRREGQGRNRKEQRPVQSAGEHEARRTTGG
jgi:hypothetical protein